MRSIYLIVLTVFVLNLCIEAQNRRTLQYNNQQLSRTNLKNNAVRSQRQQSVIRGVQQQQQLRAQKPKRQTLTQPQQMVAKPRPVRQPQPQQIIIVDLTEQVPVKQQQPKQQQQQRQRQQPQQQTQQRQPQQHQPRQQPQQPQQQRKQQQTQHRQPQQQQQKTQQRQPQQQQQRQSQQQRQPQQQQQRQPQQQRKPQPQRQTQPAPAQQQSQPQPQRQQNQNQQQHKRKPQQTAPVVTFPGETNRPRPVNPNVGFSQSNNPYLPQNVGITSFDQNIPNVVSSFASATATGDGFVTSSSSSNSFNTEGGGLSNGFNFNGDSTSGNEGLNSFPNDRPNPFLYNQNNFGQFGPGVDQLNRGPGFHNQGDGFNTFGTDGNHWHGPHRPHPNHYRDFARIFNEIDQKAETDYNQSVENDEMNDDFNGRSVVSPGQYPHMTALGYRTTNGETEFRCGGSLISEMYVLTAAHCCLVNGQSPHLVKIGDIKLKEFEHNILPQRRGIARVHKHPYYNSSLNYNDIGLLELTNPIEYTFFVRPIRLWARDEIPYDKVFTMGYGSTSFAQAPTNVLTELDLSLVPLNTCNSSMPIDDSSPYGITESQLCAKDFEKNRDTCQGDSGGPLQLNLERPRRRRLRYYLVGIISYGASCRSEYPGVYTRVSSYIDWIASIVWPNYFNEFQ